MPGDKRPVTTKHHASGTDLVQQEAQRGFVADNRVVEELTLVGARSSRDRSALRRSTLPTAVNPSHCVTSGTTTVGNASLEIGTGFKNAAQDKSGHDDSVF